MNVPNYLLRVVHTILNRKIPKKKTKQKYGPTDRVIYYKNEDVSHMKESTITVILDEIEKTVGEKIVSIKNAIFLVLAAVVAMLCCLIAEVGNPNNIGVVIIIVASAVSGIALFATCGTRAYYSPSKKTRKRRKSHKDVTDISDIARYWSLSFDEFEAMIVHFVRSNFNKELGHSTMTTEERIRALFIHQQLCEFSTKKRGVKIAVGCLIVALTLLIIASVLAFCGIDLSYSSIFSFMNKA